MKFNEMTYTRPDIGRESAARSQLSGHSHFAVKLCHLPDRKAVVNMAGQGKVPQNDPLLQ